MRRSLSSPQGPCSAYRHRIVCAIVAFVLTFIAQVAAPAERIVVSRASPETGLRGWVAGAGTRIQFESRVSSGLLTSRITARDGRTLWLYTESLGRRGEDALFIVVGKVRFTGSYTPDVQAEMDALATSPEGDLLRALAIEIQGKAPGAALVAERRGLETAYQALQQSYPGFGAPQLFGAANIGDYLVTSHGEYVVKTQHPDAVFMANSLPADRREEAESAESAAASVKAGPPRNATLKKIFEKDDPHIGDDCFGMCGKGCTDFFGCGFEGWSHEWVGEPTATTSGWTCECSRKQDGGSCGEPFGAQRWDFDGDAVHTIRGRSSPGCIAHDWCCRNLPFGCLDPVCVAIMPVALDCFFNGWPVSWSYVGPHHEAQIIFGNPGETCYCEPCQPTEEY